MFLTKIEQNKQIDEQKYRVSAIFVDMFDTEHI